MMNNPTAKKFFGAILAAITLTMVTSVAPASAATKIGDGTTLKSDTSSTVTVQKKDTGWGGF
jgi:poly-D-alanine transfer protein DltD